MTREWKPGDLVEAYVPSRSRRHVLVYLGKRGGTWPWRLVTGDNDVAGAGIGAENVKDVQPLLPDLDGLVVIDPGDRDQVKALLDAWFDLGAHAEPEYPRMAAALRSLITPPRPPEPTGLGAVVEDEDGVRWIRHCGELAPWHRSDAAPSERAWRYYADIAVIKGLSPGVTP